MNELSTFTLLQTAAAIAEVYPSPQQRLAYKKLIDAVKALKAKTPDVVRADIETQVALADAIDDAMERGEATKQHIGAYQVGTHEIPGAEVDRWRKLRAIPDEEREEYYSDIPKPSRNGLLKWWHGRTVEGNLVVDAGTNVAESKTTCDLKELAGQKFGTIYADPPWAYGNQGTRAATGNHYGTMSIKDICDLPVRDLVADDAHLHLWTTNSFLRESFELIDAWGFEYKSCAVWVKPQMGIGNYVRVSHEFLMIAVRGNAKSFIKKNVMSWFEHPRTKHSAKPDYWRRVIQENSPGPYLELFGREQIPGWTVFGNQINQQQRIT